MCVCVCDSKLGEVRSDPRCSVALRPFMSVPEMEHTENETKNAQIKETVNHGEHTLMAPVRQSFGRIGLDTAVELGDLQIRALHVCA